MASPSRQNREEFYGMKEKSRLGLPTALLKARHLGLSTHFTTLSWELTKKETSFTVDLFILTSKPIK